MEGNSFISPIVKKTCRHCGKFLHGRSDQPLLCKYLHNNKAAGTRLRKAYQEIKVLAQAGRAEVTELKNKS
jgi:hypothetical protein